MSLSPHDAHREVVVLVGHPKPSSRTGSAATSVATSLAGGPAHPVRVIELSSVMPPGGPADDGTLHDAQQAVRHAGVLVVATPVYKAGPTGLLKTFLDTLEPTALEAAVVVPVVVSGSSAHGSLADLQLRIVLPAVGALLPVPSVVLDEHHLDDLTHYVEAWHERFGTVVEAARVALRPEEVAL